MIERCAWHKPHGLGYLDFFRWADEKTSKGHVQTQCEICKHWYFKEQMGKPPKAVAKNVRSALHG